MRGSWDETSRKVMEQDPTLMVQDPGVTDFLREFINKDQARHEAALLSLIEATKRDRSDMAASTAANAITLLNAINMNFSGMNFSRIRVPRVVLSGGIFDSTDLEGADLHEVRFIGTWLKATNLRGTLLPRVQFGERPYLKFDDGILCCAYSKDKRWLAVGCANYKIYLYETVDYRLVHTFKGHTNWVRSIAFGPGNLLASGSKDKTVRLWDVESYQCVGILSLNAEVYSVALSEKSEGLFLATGSRDKAVRYWELLKNGDEYRFILRWASQPPILELHDAQIEGARMDPMTHRLLTQRGALGNPIEVDAKDGVDVSIDSLNKDEVITAAVHGISSFFGSVKSFFDRSPSPDGGGGGGGGRTRDRSSDQSRRATS